MTSISGSSRAERSNDEEKVPENCDNDGDNIERDPAPLVVVVDGVGPADAWITDNVTHGGFEWVWCGMNVLWGHTYVGEHFICLRWREVWRISSVEVHFLRVVIKVCVV